MTDDREKELNKMVRHAITLVMGGILQATAEGIRPEASYLALLSVTESVRFSLVRSADTLQEGEKLVSDLQKSAKAKLTEVSKTTDKHFGFDLI